MLPIIAIVAFLSAFGGGLLALRFRDKLHIILGFAAGAVLGVAFFDLLPEAIEILEATEFFLPPLTLVAIAFFAYLILDRLFFPHCHGGEHCGNAMHRGRFAAGGLSFHSFLDGAAVGVAFQASPALGLVVALAVLAHSFSDGINTVGMIARYGGSRAESFKWLTLNALAPVVGILLTYFVVIQESAIGPLLAIFAGFFLYLGAADLLPESHHSHPTRWTTVATIAGVILVYLVVLAFGAVF
jgi:ZIP family zinc transporter